MKLQVMYFIVVENLGQPSALNAGWLLKGGYCQNLHFLESSGFKSLKIPSSSFSLYSEGIKRKQIKHPDHKAFPG